LKLERDNRQLNNELQKLAEQTHERTQQYVELEKRLVNREHELNEAKKHLDSNDEARVMFQRQIRECQTKLDDLNDDIDSERQTRVRLENEKRQLIDELQVLRNDILERPDIEQVRSEFERNRNEDVSKLNGQLDDIRRHHEIEIGNLRQKHVQQVNELTNQLDRINQQLNVVNKSYQALQIVVNDRSNDIKLVSNQKQESERKRRQLESSWQELQHKYNENERIKNDRARTTQSNA
jgi:myosin heavy chain 9/10/11/14